MPLLLQDLPAEVLIAIFGHLDEADLATLQTLSRRFRALIRDEELWKTLFRARLHTIHFPSFSLSHKFSTEFVHRRQGIHLWKHNRAVKTKYVIQPTRGIQLDPPSIERVVFDYPRCACYNDGIITLVQLHARRQRQRLTYIPCTTPQGCSTMDFNINAAVFGRFDGRVYGKSLTNKSYLTPVAEFNAGHATSVTAIAMAAGGEDCVSASENGEIIWWNDTKLVKRLQISQTAIFKVAMNREITVAVDAKTVHVLHEMDDVHSFPLPYGAAVQFLKMDFGARVMVLATTTSISIVSFNKNNDFRNVKTMDLAEQNLTISDIFIDNQTTLRDQDTQLAGGDGCYIAVLFTDNQVGIINIRQPGSQLKFDTLLQFEGKVFTCAITNLVLVCALDGILHIIDPSNGELIKTVQKTEKMPQFLKLSQGRMIVGSGNTIHYLQYVNDDSLPAKKHSHGKSRSNKWNETLHSELEMFEEHEKLSEQRARENSRLQDLYGGDFDENDEEDIQLKIALLESQQAVLESRMNNQEGHSETAMNSDDELQRAIRESELLHNNAGQPVALDEDEELARILEQSRLDSTENDGWAREQVRGNLATEQHLQQHDEELELAIALSLSEANS
ncbi:SCF ubiquitin ligase complex subunit UFO1 KNAG_0J00150 [Huiozyma naganishii CBS 8797]|uniref:F-box domain-containing protein n=1 Tax=Huiozyma naganishii (strain ATCC MYA-139 / BCRC 22969 / CBS 8797 / KCTC 17520 / NBRC 10181 / NCYC 3082 / Yp74L-3) TaxID=1071383 RepID=J7RQM9_HUIN7|nr:hypothetical protein KNAG_0J00150 [Kazachstania naganishii CBS 8797]CCK72098.1 hypothetical protein KNAG_0J00150 [Kazachstania naganishii CBS 8797]